MLTSQWKAAIANEKTEEFECMLQRKYPKLVKLATSRNPIHRGGVLEMEHICRCWNLVQGANAIEGGVVPPWIAEVVIF